MSPRRVQALDDSGLGWARRGVWVVCIGIYLAVFIGGIQAGGAELLSLGRAVGLTLVAAWLGSVALGLIGRASLPVEEMPMAGQDGPIGSLLDLVSSTNVAEHKDLADAA